MFAAYLYQTELFRKLLTSIGYGTFHRFDLFGALSGTSVDPAVGLPIYRDPFASMLSYFNLAPMVILFLVGLASVLRAQRLRTPPDRMSKLALPLLLALLAFTALMAVIVDVRRGLDFMAIGGLPFILIAVRTVIGPSAAARRRRAVGAALVLALLVPSVSTV